MQEIHLEGCNFFRQNIIYSLLSGCTIKIENIRKYDEPPGFRGFERKFLSIIDQITNGTTEIRINKSGTHLQMKPGILNGNEIEVDCGIERCISYFMEPLMLIAPFCKYPLNLRLKGITNAPNELSVDALNTIWLPLFSRFVLADTDPSIKINARGFFPDGGGNVTFTSPIKRNLRAVQCIKPGKICKIRGFAYVSKVSPSIASRMIEGAKKMLHGYIADVYITIDQRKGQQGGLSPGFGIFIFAETTEGVFYHGEAMSHPKGSNEQKIPEEVGQMAAKRLLSEIYKGGCTDSSAQSLAATFMTLCDKDVSKFLLGPLTIYCVHTLRNLKLFFNHSFKLDEFWKIENEVNGGKKKLQTGSEDKCLLTCTGIGYYNINKNIL